MAPTETRTGREILLGKARHGRSLLIGLAFAASVVVAGCSSSAASPGLHLPSTSTSDPTAATKSAVLSAWIAAETAFYQAEASPQGLFSPSLAATMVGPELLLVKTHLAGDESSGFIGKGKWSLGSPRVIYLGPAEDDPTTATVVACVDDAQILINEHTGQPASGAAGTAEWAGETSTMALTNGTWKLSQQSGVGNTNRSIACAGIS